MFWHVHLSFLTFFKQNYIEIKQNFKLMSDSTVSLFLFSLLWEAISSGINPLAA